MASPSFSQYAPPSVINLIVGNEALVSPVEEEALDYSVGNDVPNEPGDQRSQLSARGSLQENSKEAGRVTSKWGIDNQTPLLIIVFYTIGTLL